MRPLAAGSRSVSSDHWHTAFMQDYKEGIMVAETCVKCHGMVCRSSTSLGLGTLCDTLIGPHHSDDIY